MPVIGNGGDPPPAAEPPPPRPTVVFMEGRRDPNSRRSTVMYRVGGRMYPLRNAANCYVCSSEHRSTIEEELLKGYGYAAVVRHLPEDAGINKDNVVQHVKRGHLPLDVSVRRAIIEDRATAIGKQIEDAEGTIIDHLSFARLGLQRVCERMAEGTLLPDIKDGIEFAKLIIKMDELAGDGQALDQQVIFRGFLEWMKAIQRVCTPEQVREIGALLSTNTVIRSMLNRVPGEEEASGN